MLRCISTYRNHICLLAQVDASHLAFLRMQRQSAYNSYKEAKARLLDKNIDPKDPRCPFSLFGCVCMCMCMYICIYVYLCICIRISVYLYVCICIYVYMCICIRISVYMYICTGPRHASACICSLGMPVFGIDWQGASPPTASRPRGTRRGLRQRRWRTGM